MAWQGWWTGLQDGDSGATENTVADGSWAPPQESKVWDPKSRLANELVSMCSVEDGTHQIWAVQGP